ncbi:MAG: exonuclease domain-containing protein [Patescibacteria group bacterium UBA2163]
MNVVIFDLEFTAWEGTLERNWSDPDEYREVVHIGAITVNSETLKEEEECSIFVTPTINPQLSLYFTELTSITQQQVDAAGVSFKDAIAELHTFTNDAPIYSWGDDAAVLRENCELHTVGFPFNDGQFFDMRDVFIKQGVDAHAYSSSTIPQAFDMQNPYKSHNALNDARSILLGVTQLPNNPFQSPTS